VPIQVATWMGSALNHGIGTATPNGRVRDLVYDSDKRATYRDEAGGGGGQRRQIHPISIPYPCRVKKEGTIRSFTNSNQDNLCRIQPASQCSH
jgi:hypothetical protein